MSLLQGISYCPESVTTPTRFPGMDESEDGDTDTSSLGNNTSDGSPSLRQALSGEDAIESPPLRPRPTHAIKTTRTSKDISSPSEEDPDSSANSSPTSCSSHDKPSQSYIALISMAILQHPEKKMLLGDIYQFIMDKFPHYKNSTDKAWRNSIRHNLSINECFIKAGRADNGKGNFWAIHPACEEDFGKGDFRRRQARRRARRSQQMNISKMPLTYRYSLGYVPMKSTPTGAPNAHTSLPASYNGSPPIRSHPYARRSPPTQYQYPQTQTYNHQISPPGMSSLLHHQSPYAAPAIVSASSTTFSSTYPSTVLSPLRSYANFNSLPNSLTSTPSTMGASPYLPVARPLQNSMDSLQGMYHGMHSANTSNNALLASRTYGIPQTGQASSDSFTSCVYQARGGSPTLGSHMGVPTSSPSLGSAEIIDNHVSSQSAFSDSTDNTSPQGGSSLYNGSHLINYTPLSYCDMPALRDAINGLANLSS